MELDGRKGPVPHSRTHPAIYEAPDSLSGPTRLRIPAEAMHHASYGAGVSAERAGSGRPAWSRSPRRFLLPAVEVAVAAALLGFALAVGYVTGILSGTILVIIGLGRIAGAGPNSDSFRSGFPPN